MSAPDLRGFRLVNGKIVTTLPKWTEIGREPEPFHPAGPPDEPNGANDADPIAEAFDVDRPPYREHEEASE